MFFLYDFATYIKFRHCPGIQGSFLFFQLYYYKTVRMVGVILED